MVIASLWLVQVPGCTRPIATPPAQAPADGMRRVPLGLCEDYPEETRSLDEVDRDLALVKRLGLSVLRTSIGWDDVEPRDDQFEFRFWDQVVARAAAAGVRLIPYVAYAPAWAVARPLPPGEADDHWRHPPDDPREFGQVMEVLARRYRGRITSWELWNEPDNRDYWRGDAGEYAALLKEGARGVRRGDPDARTVLGGLAGTVAFLDQLFGRHGIAPFVDVVNVHAYYETWNGEPLERLTTYLDEVAAAARAGGPRPIWLAEVGYSTFRRDAQVSPHYRARYDYEHRPAFAASALVRTVTLALASPHVALLAWYEVKDAGRAAAVIGDDNNRHLGVAYPDHRPKPAAAALALMVRLFGAGHRVLPAPAPRVLASAPAQPRPPLQLHTFQLAAGDLAVVSWIPTNPPGAPSPAGRGDTADPRWLRFELPLPCGHDTQLSLQDHTGSPLPAPSLRREAATTLVGPIVLTGERVVILRASPCRSRDSP